jgi:hypothetical protein
MKNKYMLVLIVSVIALVGFLCLPYISILGYEISVVDLLEGESDPSFSVILAVLGGVAAIIACALKKKLGALLGNIAGAAGVVLLLVDVLGDAGDAAGQVFDVLGSAVWVGLIGYIVAAVLASKIEE